MLKARNIVLLTTLVLAFFLGWYFRSNLFPGSSTKTDINLVMNTFKEVANLSTVEMPLSEILSHKKYYTYDWDIFSGKLIYKATGKVVAGIDVEELNLEIDSLTKTVYFNRNIEPKIHYVECDISYYDIQEGLFFSFESEDFNEVQKIGKETLSEAAQKSDILQIAEKRWEQILTQFENLLKASGWTMIHQSEIKILEYSEN